ncbi:MAG: 5-(carboxyamino)imidazole ribonucleotide mutase [Bdellovibrionales bacterium RIFOXYD1_FULL_44_7]|nr:MAG: 5-(carboxyamino)imidazole ribonucleotide mutase [Bdellovibrionales bacterium RIFOXYD1_FULL_44_7]
MNDKKAKKVKGSLKISIVMGSDSDIEIMRGATQALQQFGVSYEVHILSAHRAPDETAEFAKKAGKRGIRVIIAGAGAAAHLPGIIAAHTEIPVIGVPIASGVLQGKDSLLSIVQMPKGVPVATVAIGNAYNAGLLAVQIIAAGGIKTDLALLEKLRQFKEQLRKQVLSKKADI